MGFKTSSGEDWEKLAESVLDESLMMRLCDLAHALLGIRFVMVFPKEDGWGEQWCSKGRRPEFCSMMMSSPGGKRKCEMFHAMVSINACSRKPEAVQRCHAGGYRLAWPVETGGEPVAVLSTCFVTDDPEDDGWDKARTSGREFGLHLRELRKAYSELPRLSSGDVKTAEMMLHIAADAVDCCVRDTCTDR